MAAAAAGGGAGAAGGRMTRDRVALRTRRGTITTTSITGKTMTSEAFWRVREVRWPGIFSDERCGRVPKLRQRTPLRCREKIFMKRLHRLSDPDIFLRSFEG